MPVQVRGEVLSLRPVGAYHPMTVVAQRGCRIDFALGAATEDRLFGALDAKRMATRLAVTTDDGSSGEKGLVSDVLPDMIARNRTEVIYACGPMGMLRAVADIAAEFE